jgi:thymidylate synthase (FAD)
MDSSDHKRRLVSLNEIKVLDEGYVRLVDYMGNDLSAVNAARVSYDKEVDELSDKDKRLLAFLDREEHTSPFRHSALSFEVYAPLFVARQWWKYAVSSTHVDDQNGWNESSRRYITEDEQFYVPVEDQWRSKPENSKQGSGEPVDPNIGYKYFSELVNTIERGTRLYHEAIDEGIAPEQARLFLPAYGMYVRWRWTASFQAVAHFVKQRVEHDAQFEIQQYAVAVRDLTRVVFPDTMDAIGL